MPSFWNYFCFPRRRYETSNQMTPKRKRKEQAQSKSLTIVDQSFMGYTEVSDTVRTFTEYQRDGSAQRLVDDQRPNKRRRVQDTFTPIQNSYMSMGRDISSDRYSSSCRNSYNKFPKDYEGSFNYDQRDTKLFGESYDVAVTAAGRGVTNVSEHGESMYGYVPKVVQHVYASTALEGRKLDDFFGNCHQDSWLNMFASADKVRSVSGINVTNRPVNIIPTAHRQANMEMELDLIDLNSSGGRTQSQNCCRTNATSINIKPMDRDCRNLPTGHMANILSTSTYTSPSNIHAINTSSHKHDNPLLLNARFTQSPQQNFNTDRQHDRHVTNTPNYNIYGNSTPTSSHRMFETLVRKEDVLY